MMNIGFKVLFVAYATMIGSVQAASTPCSEQCNVPFGTLVGQAFKTKAYSNCNGRCVKNDDNYVQLPHAEKPIFSGMKWQCVEYARRWLIENKGVTFQDVKYAYRIWDLAYAERIDTHAQVRLQHFENKITTEPPKVGDLFINSVKLAITGHVSVVVGVERDSVTIAEQNYFNRPWEGKDYARRLLMDKDAKGRYRIFDDALIGWVRVAM